MWLLARMHLVLAGVLARSFAGAAGVAGVRSFAGAAGAAGVRAGRRGRRDHPLPEIDALACYLPGTGRIPSSIARL